MPEPICNDGEVLVAMRACGICGTDVKTYVRGHPLIPPGSVLGHEVAGVVVESRRPDFATGDRVVAAPYAPCLSCEACRQGHYSLCEDLFESSMDPGGFAEMVRIPRRIADQALFKLPDNLDFMTASLTEPLACCIHGLEALDLRAGQSLLIMGDGPMGLLQAVLGKALGASPVILSGITPHRLGFARKVADVVIDVSTQNLVDELKLHTPYGPEKIIVSVGNADVVQEALELVAKGGAVNIFAGMPKDAMLTLPVNRIHYDEIRILGTFGFGPQHFRQALDVLAQNDNVLKDMFTHTTSLDSIEDALQASSRYEGIKGVVLV
ncbi:MAG: alcohol dehydrogenase catalytic domain-containing protein [Anaerolineaceae bacterium]|nr:alcohol dehydrogenase catalytic domain-containing protein [Anaerolineaceae bacterium]